MLGASEKDFSLCEVFVSYPLPSGRDLLVSTLNGEFSGDLVG